MPGYSLNAQHLFRIKLIGTLNGIFKSGAINSEICSTCTHRYSSAAFKNRPVTEYVIYVFRSVFHTDFLPVSLAIKTVLLFQK